MFCLCRALVEKPGGSAPSLCGPLECPSPSPRSQAHPQGTLINKHVNLAFYPRTQNNTFFKLNVPKSKETRFIFSPIHFLLEDISSASPVGRNYSSNATKILFILFLRWRRKFDPLCECWVICIFSICYFSFLPVDVSTAGIIDGFVVLIWSPLDSDCLMTQGINGKTRQHGLDTVGNGSDLM